MTIKNIKSIFPDPMVVEPKDFESQTICVDTSIFLYKYCYGYQENFLKGFESLLKQWKKSKLIFVFDGPPPVLKQKLIEKRKEIKEKSESKINITTGTISSLKELFDSKQIEYIVAPNEAERICCSLNPDAVLSNDFDCFLFGCKKLIRNLKGTNYHVYSFDIILNEIKLSKEQFIELAIACGTDYNLNGVKNYGPKKSLKYIQNNKSIQILFDEDCFLALKEINSKQLKEASLNPQIE